MAGSPAVALVTDLETAHSPVDLMTASIVLNPAIAVRQPTICLQLLSTMVWDQPCLPRDPEGHTLLCIP